MVMPWRRETVRSQAPAALPPIDQRVPDGLLTATFASG